MESALRRGADASVRLIETLRWDGAAFGLLELHLARLARGAAALGYPLAVDAVVAALDAAVAQGVAARVRLTLGAEGGVEVTVAALPAPVAEWRVGLAQARLWSGDPWLGVKSTRRTAYDVARAALPAGLDEVIFLNERGEVCDGTITTVFFDRGAGMRTPPLACGLLPGVLRASLGVPEEVLLGSELGARSGSGSVRLWVGNALRGLMVARFAG